VGRVPGNLFLAANAWPKESKPAGRVVNVQYIATVGRHSAGNTAMLNTESAPGFSAFPGSPKWRKIKRWRILKKDQNPCQYHKIWGLNVKVIEKNVTISIRAKCVLRKERVLRCVFFAHPACYKLPLSTSRGRRIGENSKFVA